MIFDKVTDAILRHLQHDGRLSNAELAQRVGLSPSACLRRVKLLEKNGIIQGYRAIIDRNATRSMATVIVQITLERQTEDCLRRFESRVRECPDVKECYLMTGDADYLLRVEAQDMSDYERIHKEELSRMPGVVRIQSNFAIRPVVQAWKS
ncbi:Lrp/AsnC family transcriptional regulator [Acetobacter indonesiensis]|jgi:DNA-binding Lrp family transcriptional regulator|uniref:Transcriptional regulator n=1 Tax=Acetobacter indonesiensis TaxID=104101 RepID=A0A252AW37_9PROT|nr:Lrp/AsnC family transcriptional regulator [Acetobacter indonesiensis]MCG0995363.1 Lrp/AsnC family transcriptional regulator [Acetobacter indonesiensis]MCI1438597.1 Lrp/AsnC family transcriptional regulator [Acetobacter indonesiensis]MCI1546909.1 Lrp/AsnC family transcriptional regulator [Acetobacter indonesiensis]MCI1766253.1 Lrp/AsnC family transcriptional regulator [Acetobacter indonesiensis]MCP1230336.1 Lrp/AsnC family transcriptional regulator [Acetobacter indonesiensis]